MDLLLYPDLVAALCGPSDESTAAAQIAVQQCQESGHRVWLYAGAVSQYRSAFTSQWDPPVAATKFAEFIADKQWLAALAQDVPDFNDPDPIAAQFLNAVQRFAPDDLRLLTRDPGLLARNSASVMMPEQLPTQPGEARLIEFIDLATQQDRIRSELEANLHCVLRHGRYIMGPEIGHLEQKLASFVGVDHCIACASGSDALLIALLALGIEPGDEVITTPFSFIATAEMIVLLSARPVFVDIDPQTYNLDPAQLEAAITARTRAIMPVSLYGQCADFDAINAIAARHGLPVIEDAAQSFGASYKGRMSCALSTIACTSFFPSKPLGAYGDAGACFTHDDQLATRMREIRVHGQDRRYHHRLAGINGRMDTLQAAVLLAKLPMFAEEIQARQRVGQYYTDLFAAHCQSAANAFRIVPPLVEPHNTSVYAQYTIQTDHRDTLQAKLKSAGFPTAIHYPIPLNQQPAIQPRCAGGLPTPTAAALSTRVLSLPMHPFLAAKHQEAIVREICGSVE